MRDVNKGVWRLQKSFINVFAVPDFHNQDDKSLVMNFINYPIIAGSYFMERIIAFHFGCGRLRQIFGKVVDSFFNLPKNFIG